MNKRLTEIKTIKKAMVDATKNATTPEDDAVEQAKLKVWHFYLSGFNASLCPVLLADFPAHCCRSVGRLAGLHAQPIIELLLTCQIEVITETLDNFKAAGSRSLLQSLLFRDS